MGLHGQLIGAAESTWINISTNYGKQVRRVLSFFRTTPCIVAFASPLVSAMPTDTLA
jgi:hypothetical protein